jgi:hypothetical protein
MATRTEVKFRDREVSKVGAKLMDRGGNLLNFFWGWRSRISRHKMRVPGSVVMWLIAIWGEFVF